jgi:O-antigen ligase
MEVQRVARSLPLGGSSAILHVPLAAPIPKWVRWTFLSFVATIPFEGLSLPFFAEQGMTLPKLLGFLFVVAYLFSDGFPLKLSLPVIPTALWWFLGYLLIYIANGLFVRDETIRQYVTRMVSVSQQLVLFWFASDLLRDANFAKKCLLTVVGACAVLALGTLLNLPGFAPEHATDRLAATGSNANDVGAWMAYAGIVVVGFYIIQTGWSAKAKLVLLLSAIPILYAMVATGSRGAIGSFIIGIGFFFVPHRGSKKQMMSFGLALAGILAIVYLVVHDPATASRWTKTVEEGDSRWPIYATAWNMFEEKPLVGWGGAEARKELGLRLAYRSQNRAAHNFILHLLIEVGLVGTIPFMIAVWLCVRAAWKGRVDRFGLLPFALLMALLAYNMTHTGLSEKMFWLFLGFAVAASSIHRELRYRWVT